MIPSIKLLEDISLISLNLRKYFEPFELNELPGDTRVNQILKLEDREKYAFFKKDILDFLTDYEWRISSKETFERSPFMSRYDIFLHIPREEVLTQFKLMFV